MKIKRFIVIIIALFPLIINAQNYDNLWAEFNKNIENRLPESAVKVLDNIEKQAVKDKNDVQLLKVVINRCNVIKITSETPEDSIINYCKAQLPRLSEASQIVLNVEIANLMERYCFTLKYSHEYIENQRIKAAEDAKRLGNVSMKDYIQIFAKKGITYELDLEPTIYDFAMHNLLNSGYCRDYNNEQDIDEYNNAYSQLIEFDKQYGFIKAAYMNRIHQIEDLITYYSTHNGDNERVSFYYAELDSLLIGCEDKVIISRIKASQAGIMMSQNNYVEALRLCDEVISMNTKCDSYTKCVECRNVILQKTATISMQQVQLPGKNIPVGLTYKNTTNPSYRIYKINSNELKTMWVDSEDLLKLMTFKELVVENSFVLKEEKDYQEHSTLVALPPLECGTYILLTSATDNFEDLEKLGRCRFQVSNLSYIKNNFKEENVVYTLDRETGQPIDGVTVDLIKCDYNYTTRSRECKSVANVVSDVTGVAVLPENIGSVSVSLYYENDTLRDDSFSNLSYFVNTDRYDDNAHFYLDRPIYRLGQTVKFKGIVTRDNGIRFVLCQGYKLKVSIKDANYSIIETKYFTTDENGTFSGSFEIPTDRLKGLYRIESNYGAISFRVEDYKRPTFEINIDNPTREYSLYDSISVAGKIMALSGFGLENVKYEYTIERNTTYPYRLWWCNNIRNNEKQMICSGEGVSGKDGVFNIDFQLNPGRYVKPESMPMFTYSIKVKATNAQGETEEATYNLVVTCNKYDVKIEYENTTCGDDGDVVTIEDFKKSKVLVSNILGNPVATNIECKIYKIDDSGRLGKTFFSKKFDRQIFTDEQLKSMFPHFDFYKNDDASINENNIVYQGVISVDGTADLFSNNPKLKDGKYVVELKSVDDTLSQFSEKLVLFNPNSAKMPVNALGWTKLDKTHAKPGDVVNFYIGSAAEDVMAIVVIDNGNELIKRERVSLNNNVKLLSHKVTDEDRGRLNFSVSFVKYNDCFNQNQIIEVPHDNLKLDIKLETERNSLLPGSEENLNVTICDYKKNGITASLLAGMYDASLDVFNGFFNDNKWELKAIPMTMCSSSFKFDCGFNNETNYTESVRNYTFYFNYGTLCSDNGLFTTDSNYSRKYIGNKNGEILCVADVMDYKVPMIYKDDGNSSEATAIKDVFEFEEETPAIQIRSNFNETAFFYPNLKTDENGNATFSFTMPDALTRWKLRMLAYSKDLKVGTLEKTFVTQKPVMIMADMPRFCYDEDTLWLVANVVNLSEEAISPVAKLEIIDEGLEMREEMILSDKEIKMEEIPAGRSQSVRWKVAMKKDVNLLTFRFSATADNFCDAEQHTMPVLNTEVFMTQTFSLIAKGNEKKTYNFNIKEKDERNHAITLNFSKNPTWYAVQALPYLDKENEKYAESAFYRYFTNSVAKHIASSLKDSPEMAKLLESIENDSTSTMSELERNQDLKEILLNETPWVLDAKNESEQRANITKLFDTKALDKNINSALKIIEKKQKPSGGWAWVEGMPESAYVTQYILGGLGRLRSLTNGDEQVANNDLENIIAKKAFHFIENDVVKRFSDLKEADKKNYRCSVMIVRELFVMSYFPEFETNAKFKEAKAFYIEKLKKDWTKFNFEAQADIALIFNRNGNKNEALEILKSLRECAQKNELGMYWFEGKSIGVEDEARILEAFNEIDPKNDEIDAMRFWILGEKRTNMWDNDRATAEAIYAIINRGTNWLNDNGEVVLTVNDNTIACSDRISESDRINKIYKMLDADVSQANVSIDNQTNHQVWGGMFRQYFVPIDKVKKSNEDMKIRRELFVERIEDNKTKYLPISEEEIKVGDKIKIVLYIENQQNMEFVYLKDLRGACFEPTGQISRYHYSDGLWYYQSTSDVAMEFFFDNMPKGKHELSHTVYVTKEGSFSAGYAVIQCQYAPEFGAYSDGSRISVSGE